jgi:hypothetical protein
MTAQTSVAVLIERGFADKGLPPEQLDTIVESLPTLDPAASYKALWLIGYSHDVRLRGLLETYLHRTGDPELAAVALKMLSDCFGLSTAYIGYVREALAGFEWDIVGDVMAEALVAAGRILHDAPANPDLAERIYAELTAEHSSLKAHAAGAACAALGLTSLEQARIPLDGSPELVQRFKDRFLV